MARGARPDNGNFLSIGRPSLHHVALQRLSEVPQKTLDRTNRDGFVVLSAIASLLARVITHATGDRGKRHIFLDERVGVEILPALHKVQIALDLFVRSAGVVAGRHLVPVDRPDRAPIPRRKQVLPFFLRWRRRNAGKRHGKPVGNMSTFG